MDSIDVFLRYLFVAGFAPGTIAGYRSLLRDLKRYAAGRGIDDPKRCTESVLLDYIRSGKRSGAVTFNVVCRLKQYYRYLVKQDLVYYSPIETYTVTKLRSISRTVLSATEMRTLLDRIRTDAPVHVRTRAILELAYSSALRPCEIRNLRIDQIDANGGTLFIERTKNRKDRKIPVGAIALEWIGRYFREVRSRFLGGADHSYLFISHRGGNPLSASGLWRGIESTLSASGIASMKPHSIRASGATVLLEAGMHVAYIAELLGHTELSTTQIYLRLHERSLTREIRDHHPRNHMALMTEEE